MNRTEFIILSFTVLRRTFGVTFWSEKPEKKEVDEEKIKAFNDKILRQPTDDLKKEDTK